MIEEFGIIDDRGKLFGLPIAVWNVYDAAKATFDHLTARRGLMKREAYDAAMRLQAGVRNMDERYHLEEVVEQWNREKDRRFFIVRREVTEWERVG